MESVRRPLAEASHCYNLIITAAAHVRERQRKRKKKEHTCMFTCLKRVRTCVRESGARRRGCTRFIYFTYIHTHLAYRTIQRMKYTLTYTLTDTHTHDQTAQPILQHADKPSLKEKLSHKMFANDSALHYVC